MTHFAISDADVWNSPGEKAASIDLLFAEADILHNQRPWNIGTDPTVIPEYPVLNGTVNRFPLGAWNWAPKIPHNILER